MSPTSLAQKIEHRNTFHTISDICSLLPVEVSVILKICIYHFGEFL